MWPPQLTLPVTLTQVVTDKRFSGRSADHVTLDELSSTLRLGSKCATARTPRAAMDRSSSDPPSISTP